MFKIASKNKGANSIEFIKGTDGEDIIWKTEEEAREQIRLFGITVSPFSEKITHTKPMFFDWVIIPEN